MSESETAKRVRGRPRVLSNSAKKRRKSENDNKWNKTRINIGVEYARWNNLKEDLQMKTNAEVAPHTWKTLFAIYSADVCKLLCEPGYCIIVLRFV